MAFYARLRARADLLQAEPELARKLGQLTSIPGIGLTTAIVVVAEINPEHPGGQKCSSIGIKLRIWLCLLKLS